MAPRLKSGISIWDSQIISSGLYELIFFRIWFAGSLIQAKNPGRQVRLHEQPSPATSYFLFEVVFFDGSTVNLLNFNSPEEFFEAFQVCLKRIHYCIWLIFKADVEAFYNEEIDPYDLVFEFYNNLERDFPTLDLLFRFPNRPDNWNEIGKIISFSFPRKSVQVHASDHRNAKALKEAIWIFVIWIMKIGDTARLVETNVMPRRVSISDRNSRI